MLIVPIFSMRSYATGRYSILKDGNFQRHLHTMTNEDYIILPINTVPGEVNFLIDNGFLDAWQIHYCEYGLNAVETRESFWAKNQKVIDIIAEFNSTGPILTDITGYNGDHEFYCNFNITKDPSVGERYYIDRFFDSDVDSIRRAVHTTVLNHSQKDYIVSLYPELADKISVVQKVCNYDFIVKMAATEEQMDLTPFKDVIFFPFRLSDKCYEFERVVKENQDKLIIVTDPNDTYQPIYMDMYPNVQKIKLTKAQYYQVLLSKPTVIYYEDPNKVFHPGLAEFIVTGCNIISPHQMPSIESVSV